MADRKSPDTPSRAATHQVWLLQSPNPAVARRPRIRLSPNPGLVVHLLCCRHTPQRLDRCLTATILHHLHQLHRCTTFVQYCRCSSDHPITITPELSAAATRPPSSPIQVKHS